MRAKKWVVGSADVPAGFWRGVKAVHPAFRLGHGTKVLTLGSRSSSVSLWLNYFFYSSFSFKVQVY